MPVRQSTPAQRFGANEALQCADWGRVLVRRSAEGVNEEKEKDADMMMHSVATQNDYIKTSENDDNE